ncbi:biotin--[acetyl-CoA-carboxylase] ligase [Neisseriaceae bacterium B1]
MPIESLIAALADGQPHHITELANATARPPHQLNALWQTAPAHLRGLLRQRDGMWHLVRPIAWLPESFSHPQWHTKIIHTSPSSNDELLHATKNNQAIHQHIVAVLQQDNGRGRQGRAWQARSGECLTFSLGWTFTQEQAQLGALAPIVALACQQALRELDCAAQIKWPNDLVVGLDKLGGILIETVRRDGNTHAVIGIGINFIVPKELDNVASIQTLSNKKHSASHVLHTLLNHLYEAIQTFAQQGFAPFQAAYQSAHRDQNQDIVLLHNDQIVQQGRVQGIAEDGALLLQTPQGLQKIITGEVSLRRPEQVVDTAVFRQPESSVTRYLLLDAGNSRLKWAWIENDEIMHTSHAPYRDLTRLSEEWATMGDNVQCIVGSAVCSEAKKALIAACLPEPIQWQSSVPRALGVTNHYRHPEEHGADRWFNALGSRRFSHNASVVVSCGTAVTIDAITYDKHYLGGSIMPGFHLMRESLTQKTAQLQRPEGSRYPFPTTTANAIATGMMDAVCGAILLMHQRLQQRSGDRPVDVIITGGGAAKVASALPEQFVLNHTVKTVDNLVIYGLLDHLNQSIKEQES